MPGVYPSGARTHVLWPLPEERVHAQSLLIACLALRPESVAARKSGAPVTAFDESSRRRGPVVDLRAEDGRVVFTVRPASGDGRDFTLGDAVHFH